MSWSVSSFNSQMSCWKQKEGNVWSVLHGERGKPGRRAEFTVLFHMHEGMTAARDPFFLILLRISVILLGLTGLEL